MLLNSVYALLLQSAITGVLDVLNGFAADPLFAERFEFVFGKSISSSAFQAALASLPQFEVRSDGDLAGALGAFSAQTQKIYLTESLLTGDPVRLQAVMIEEIGHFLDAQVNAVDTAGDEGELFSDLVRGVGVSSAELSRIQAENDHAVVMIDGQEVAIEMATNVFSNLFATGDASPKNFVTVGNTLYFTVYNGNNGTALWKMVKGNDPVFLKNFGPEVNGRQLRNLTAVGDILYFVAYDNTNGTAIWRSNGTSVGTVLVDPVYKNMGFNVTNDLEIGNLTAVSNTSGNYLYFTTRNSSRRYDLRKLTDSTFASLSSPLTDNSSGFSSLTNIGGTLYYINNDTSELYDASTGLAVVGAGNAVNLRKIGSDFYLTTKVSGVYYLYKANSLTLLPPAIYTGSSSPENLTAIGSNLFFTVNGQLWKNSTPIVSSFSSISNLTDVGGKLYFSADDRINGNELWKFDVTSSLLSQVQDIYPTTPSSNPSSLTSVGNILYFTAEDNKNGYGLWKTDTTNGDTTTFVHRIYRDTTAPIKNYPLPNLLLNFSNTLYFAGDGDAVHGTELWTSDGTKSGTKLVTDINSNFLTGVNFSLSSYSVHPESVVSNNILYFTAHIIRDPHSSSQGFGNWDGYDTQLWQSDGTTTKPVLDADGKRVLNPGNLTDVNNKLYFSGYEGQDNELWTIDSGVAKLFQNINLSSSSNPRNLKNIGGTLYFSADNGSVGTEPWTITPRSPIATNLKDIFPGSEFDFANSSSPTNFTNAGGKSYFTAFTPGFQLWESDGTFVGTNPVFNSNKPIAAYNLTGFGTSIYYVAFDSSTSGYQLWKHDFGDTGDSSVTRLTSRVGGAGSVGMNPSTFTTVSTFNLTNVGGVAYFAATDGIKGYELWKSDGTFIGTQMVPKDINLTGSSLPQNLIDIGGVLYFTADDGSSGRELWTSDGTLDGTYRVEDINKIGNSSSSIANLTNVDGTLYFTADDGVNGVKIWQVVPDPSRLGKMTAKIADNALFPSDLINYQNHLFFTATDPDGKGRGLQELGPSISLTVSPTSVFEDSGQSLIYTFTRTVDTWDINQSLTVDYTIGGTANFTISNKDYNYTTSAMATFAPPTGSITFGIGDRSVELRINPIADTTVETNETVSLTLKPKQNYVVNSKTAVTGTIINDDFPTITLSVVPSSVLEDSGQSLTYTFTRSVATSDPLTVNFNIATGGNNATLNGDYTLTGATIGNNLGTITGTVIFGSGRDTAQVIVTPNVDNVIEPNETVQFTLTAIATGSSYKIGSANTATGTIVDDDTPSISLGLNYSGISEDSPNNFIYTFTRTVGNNPLTVYFTTTGGTDPATLGNDYILTKGIGATAVTPTSITFAAGSRTAQLILDPTVDNKFEKNETINLKLQGVNGYLVNTPSVFTATIINDDLNNPQKGTEGKDLILGKSTGENLFGYGGADNFTGGLGDDHLFLGADLDSDIVNYAKGDGRDNVYDFVRGVGGDVLNFTGLTAIDVIKFGAHTRFTAQNNPKDVFLTVNTVSGFNASDIGVNLFGNGATFSFV